MNNDRIVESLEILNRQWLDLKHEYDSNSNKKRKNFFSEFKHMDLLSLFGHLRKKILFLNIKEHRPEENISNNEWVKSLKSGAMNTKTVIYSCITGSYDKPLKPMYSSNNIKYILFTDDYDHADGWEIRRIPEYLKEKNNSEINRYIKFHPFELFGDGFDMSVYIDGNIRPVSDLSYYFGKINSDIGIALHRHRSRSCIYQEVKACIALHKGNKKFMLEQIKRYKNVGFPEEYGMLECNVIACDLKNSMSHKLLNMWWEEFSLSKSGRDQLALPYILWKNSIPIDRVCSLGNNVYDNTKLQIVDHR